MSVEFDNGVDSKRLLLRFTILEKLGVCLRNNVLNDNRLY